MKVESPLLTKELIAKYFREERVSLTKHFIDEMLEEELGEISTSELIEAAADLELLKEYPDDKPYPSVLVLGFTKKGRPLHFVCARDDSRDVIILITIYEPREELWIDYRERKET
jgi:hypothetical protein